MSLATRCPTCQTAFRVVQDQLRVSDGWVRCGRCNQVFNALEGLFDLDHLSGAASREPSPPPGAPGAPGAPERPNTRGAPQEAGAGLADAGHPAERPGGAAPSGSWADTEPMDDLGRSLSARSRTPAQEPAPSGRTPPTSFFGSTPAPSASWSSPSVRQTPAWPSTAPDPAPASPDESSPAVTRSAFSFLRSMAGLPPSPAPSPTPTPNRRSEPGPRRGEREDEDEDDVPEFTAADVLDSRFFRSLADDDEGDLPLDLGGQPPGMAPSATPREAAAPVTPPSPAAPPSRGPQEPAWVGDPGESGLTWDAAEASSAAIADDETTHEPTRVELREDELFDADPEFSGLLSDADRAAAQERVAARLGDSGPAPLAPGAAVQTADPDIRLDPDERGPRFTAAAAGQATRGEPLNERSRRDAADSGQPRRRRKRRKEQVPSFVRQADRARRWQTPGMRAALTLGCALLMVGLGVQASVLARDHLAARWPATQPWLTALCQVAGCEIQALRRVQDLAIDSSSFTKPDPAAERYLLSLTVRNRSTLTVAMPAIELTLIDAREDVLVRRVLRPGDFSAPDVLPPGASQPLNLTLAADELAIRNMRVAGYRVLAFYP